MAIYRATIGNDSWTVSQSGDPSGTLIDGLAGIDTLSFGILTRSDFTIRNDANTGYILVDSVSGASSPVHLKLINVEYLLFSSGQVKVNLTTLFGDTTPPLISAFNPLNSGINFVPTANITIYFNEAITRGSGSISLVDANGKIVDVFTAATSPNLVVNNYTLTIEPSSPLQYGHTYSLKIDAGAIKDTSGNAFAGLSNYTFSTSPNTAPVTSTGQFTLAENSSLNTVLPPATDAQNQALTYQPVQTTTHGTLQINKDGSFGYIPDANYSGTDSFTYSANDGELNSTPSTITLSITPVVQHITGTSGNDSLVGTMGPDILQGGAGNDSIDGGSGLDVAVYSGARSNYQITNNSSSLVLTDATGKDGTDTLINVERLKFTDQSLAFDMTGGAGIVAKVLGAVFGVASIANQTYAGIGLNLVDNGMGYEQLMHLALGKVLGPNPTSAQIVTLLYTNVIGTAPPDAALKQYVSLLDNGIVTPDKLGMIAADTTYNAGNIDLVGLADHGLAYIPAG